ncbi:hypothetical protein L1889_03845 [Paenalcaligenes niemegkensis]|uniref:hypothetical protein n=1 Tax=Paenalcaligenes niemegkensis TaxID=2895469 RepID=UPI001EE86C3C|nr:hypothetical protein [Paenalcaligenes niemegkensis]MCQ9615942.1 hypothetical protein [Paenalcaligenes niemegkensis]
MGELQATMTQNEFESWVEYYKEAPFDDAHRFHRPAALVSESMARGGMTEKLEWLRGSALDAEPEATGNGQYSAADMATFAALGVKPPSV